MSTSEISALAIVTAAVVYLLAFMAHALEWASARGADVVSEQARGDGDNLARRLKVDTWGRMGIGLTIVGLASHLVGVITRGIAADRAPWGNMYEFTISALLFVMLAHVPLATRWRMRWLGLPITLLATIALGLAATVFYVRVSDLVPALHSVWFIVHIAAASIAGAAFNLGGAASILYLFRQRAEARGSLTTGYLAKLPSAKQLDTFAYRAHAFAFPIWTFTIAAGSIWAEYAWGRYWGWDPKETWSLVTWVIYAGYLHARATAGWRGRPAAIIAIIGVASFWFNFIGVNLVFNGLHSYSGI